MTSVSSLSLSELAESHFKRDTNKVSSFFSNESSKPFETSPYTNEGSFNFFFAPAPAKKETFSDSFDFSEISNLTDEINLESSPVEELSPDISSEFNHAVPSMFGLIMSGDLKKETASDQYDKIKLSYDSCFGYVEQNQDSLPKSNGKVSDLKFLITSRPKSTKITPFDFSTPSPDEIIKIKQKAIF